MDFSRDVGQSVLECYSRVLESLDFTVTSRIEDVLYADSLTQNPSLPKSNQPLSLSDTPAKLNPAEEIEKLNAMEAPGSMTLSDFMEWSLDQEMGTKKDTFENVKLMNKPMSAMVHKKGSYMKKI